MLCLISTLKNFQKLKCQEIEIRPPPLVELFQLHPRVIFKQDEGIRTLEVHQAIVHIFFLSKRTDSLVIHPNSDLQDVYVVILFLGAVVMGQVNGLNVPGFNYIHGNTSLC